VGAGVTEPVRVVVADDQRLVREGLRLMLSMLDGVDVVAVAADGDEAVATVAAHDPDVILMDLRMPRCDGVTATRRVRAEHPRTQVVVLTTFAEDAEVLAALRAGARGFLTKDAAADEVARAITRVAGGQADLAPDVQRRLLDLLPPTDAAAGTAPPDGLTEREVEVLRLIARGLLSKQVAARLGISTRTVDHHVGHIYDKLGVSSRAGAALFAVEHGLLEPED
jgi:DNA-binding NarL/FixJ family response regulator